MLRAGPNVQCNAVAEKLRGSGVTASAFYASMSEGHKQTVLADWKMGKIECVVATIAFGMGIDHAHVRYIVHYDIPKSFEGYYQETGRAGRDGHRSRCLLFYCTWTAHMTADISARGRDSGSLTGGQRRY